MPPHTVLLAGNPQYPQEKLASEAITPGHLVEVVPSGGDAGQLRRHATANGLAYPAFAIQSLTPDRTVATEAIDTPYADGETVRWIIARPGDLIYALIPAAAAAIVEGDQLEPAGGGTLRKFTTMGANLPNSIVAVAAEARDNSGGGSDRTSPGPSHLTFPGAWALGETTMRVPTLDLDALETGAPSAYTNSLPAHFLNSGLRVNSLRTNTLLRKDEWESLDNRVIEIAVNVRNGIADLEAAGLTLNLGGLGVLVSQYERTSDMTDASVNMAAEVDDEEDRINFDLIGVPVPITSKSFRIDIRSLAASRQNGSGLDTTHVDAATRKVEEMAESILFNGPAIVQRGQVIYGYTNHPNRNTVGGGGDWGTATNIIPNVTAMIGSLIGDNMYGPYKLYLHPDQYIQTMALNASTSVPILRTLESLPGLTPGSIKPSNYVTAGQGILVMMSRDVVDLAVGQDTIPVEWDTKGGLVTRWKVMSAKVPRVKAGEQLGSLVWPILLEFEL